MSIVGSCTILHITELSKFRKHETRELESDFERRLYVLKYVPEFNKTIMERFADEEGIQMAIEMYRSVTEDEIFRERLETIENSKRVYITQMNLARQEGFEEGIKLGLEEGRKLVIEERKKLGIEEGIKQTAKELKKLGVEIELIAKATKLSIEEILTL